MPDCLRSIRKFLLPVFFSAWFCTGAFCQDSSIGPALPADTTSSAFTLQPRFDVSTIPAGTFGEDTNESTATTQSSEHHGGFVSRMVKRGLEDQKGLYLAPFKPSNFKWDGLVLGGTAGLLVADRHIENNLPGGHYQFYQDSSNIAIASLSSTLAGVWIYGLKSGNPHAKELGNLELETLINTFLIYAPMQFIGARQRPGRRKWPWRFLASFRDQYFVSWRTCHVHVGDGHRGGA